MKRIWLALAFVAACHKMAPVLDAKPTREEFAKLALTHAPPGARFDAAKYALVTASDGGESGYFFLGNAYDEYCAADPSVRDKIFARFFAATEVKKGTFEEARAHLLPVVREGIYFDTAKLALKDGPKTVDVLHEPLTPLFHMAIAIDGESTIAIVSDEDTKAWKQTFAQLSAIALTNLAARSTEPFEEVKPGLWRSPWHDNYDTSRILLTKKIAALKVKGAPVVMLPNRDNVLVAGDKDHEALMAMADLAEEIMKQPRAMNTCALRLSGDHFSEYIPDVSPNAKARFVRLRIDAEKDLYDEQKQLLERDAAERKDDVFVASYEAFDDGHDVFSMSALTRGAWTLLPITERVMFVDAKDDLHDNTGMKPLGWAPWSRVTKVLGKSMKPMGLSPERYRIETFPTAAQLKALQLTHVDGR